MTNVIVAMGLITVGSAYGYTRWRLDSIHTVAAPHLTKQASGGLSPENILLIGNETRAGLNPSEQAQFGSSSEYSGSLSDVIMILHLDPAKHTAAILSIPRDLFLPMPPNSPVGPYQKIDAALNDGGNGPDNLIQAITYDLGIPINHYIELDFDGFQQTVNAIGGINIDFPEPVYDAESLLNITTTGCQHLDGTQALELVRARHLQYDPPGVSPYEVAAWPQESESDLARIARDHTFLRILVSTAESKGLTHPLTANALIGAVINQTTIDPGLKNQLLPLLSHYHNLDPATAPETTIPVTTVANYYYGGADIGDVDFPVQPLDNRVIAAWDGGALPAAVAPTGVQVDNITSTNGLAAVSAASLTAAGLHVLGTASATVPAATTETLIHYYPGQVDRALAVMSHLSGAVMLQSDSTVTPGTVVLDVGSTFAVVSAAAPAKTAPTTAAGAVPAPTTTTTVPTPGSESPSSATDVLEPWDPRPC